MLDIALVQGRPALKVEFRISLAYDLLHAIALVMDAPWYEGFDPWVYTTHAALPPMLKEDIGIVLLLIQKSHLPPLWTNRLQPGDPAHRDFTAFIAWLNGLTVDDFQSLIGNTLKGLAKHCEQELASPPSLDDTEELKTCLRVKFSKDQLGRAIQLVRNPLELRVQLISILTRFWEQFYRREHERCLPLMERSVAYHRRQNYSADLVTIFTAVTGRRFPKERSEYEEAERAIFVPSCHIGPYVTFGYFEDLAPVVTLYYNCRPTSAPERDRAPTVIQDIFPPLKALSDETRLQILSILNGRELYAQEIVEHLNISQSAVSRHLKLMLTGGLLIVRKQDNMKYFSVNERTLAALADRLESLRGKRRGRD